MGFLVKIRAFVAKKKESYKRAASGQLPNPQKKTATATPARTSKTSNYDSFLAMATVACGHDAEKFFPCMLGQAVHEQSVANISTPISRGALAYWIDYMLSTESIQLPKLNDLLGIECVYTATTTVLGSLIASVSAKMVPPSPGNISVETLVEDTVAANDLPPSRIVIGDKKADTPVPFKLLKEEDDVPKSCSAVVLWRPPTPPLHRILFTPQSSSLSPPTPGNISGETLVEGDSQDVATEGSPSPAPVIVPLADASFEEVSDSVVQRKKIRCRPPTPPLNRILFSRKPRRVPATKAFKTSSPNTPVRPSIIEPQPLSLCDFDVIRGLGAGTFGAVHLVKHKMTGRSAAIKVITKKYARVQVPKHSALDRLEDSQASEIAARWGMAVKEKHALKRVRGTTGVVELLGSFHDTENFYLVMPFYQGGDLDTRMAECGRFSEGETIFHTAELIAGIEGLHKHGIVHRDLKPANVLIDAKGHLVIADLGIAKSFERFHGELRKDTNPFWALAEAERGEVKGNMPPTPQTTKQWCGTTQYMAPEIFMGWRYSYAVDIWALGVMVFEMSVGHPPWDREELGYDFEMAVAQDPFKLEVWEVEKYKLSTDMLLFYNMILDKDQHTRPTAAALKSHCLFKNCDWDRLSCHGYSAPWVPSAPKDQPSRKGGINGGESFNAANDPFPHFSFVSPFFAPTQVPESSCYEQVSSPATPTRRPHLNRPPTPPAAMLLKSFHAASVNSPAVSAVPSEVVPKGGTPVSQSHLESPPGPAESAPPSPKSDDPEGLRIEPREPPMLRFKKWASRLFGRWKSPGVKSAA